MRILALVPFPAGRSPGQRFRIEQWMPYLSQVGIDVTLSPFLDEETSNALYAPGRTAKKIEGVLRALLRSSVRALGYARYDAIFVAREAALLGPPILESLASTMRPLVFDLDDAIWMPQAGSVNRRWQFLRVPTKAAFIARSAAHVTAGNEYLASWARDRGAADVSIVPTTVDVDGYGTPKQHRERDVLTVGWIGSHTTKAYLEGIIPALHEVSKRRKFRLLVVGAEIHVPDGLECECRPWSASREANDVREMDIGLMPLPDDEWTRGKCALKALQYLSLGVPAIVSPVGASRDAVKDGRTGIHAATPGEWIDGILKLLDSAAERERLGSAGRLDVIERFSARAVVPHLRSIFEGL